MRNFGYGFTLDEICNKAAALYSCQLAAVQQARSYTKSKAKLFFSQQAFQRPQFRGCDMLRRYAPGGRADILPL